MSIFSIVTKDVVGLVVDELDEETVRQLVTVLIEDNPRVACSILLRVIKVLEEERQYVSDSIQKILDNIHDY